ncbi:MAG: two-component regulator propeller domain-containing protein [Bacteroidota bacterium]
MKKVSALFVCLLFSNNILLCQQGFTFNRIGTDDGIGLSSNVVYCTYQDARGFIWIGNANGLQRFDGRKFVQFRSDKFNGSLNESGLAQILPADSSSLWLSFPERREFGIFNTTTFSYSKVPIKTSRSLGTTGAFRLWKNSKGEVFLSVFTLGILHYDKKQNAFIDDNYFHFPEGWVPNPGLFEDTVKQQYWFPCANKGLAVFDVKDNKLYTTQYNPRKIPLLQIKKIITGSSDFFIDSKRRHWAFNWTTANLKFCFDADGKERKDTAGLNYNPDYSELRFFYETRKGLLWMYGTNALYNFDNNEKRFAYYEHGQGSTTGIQFHYVNQVMEDHDGNIWLSTDNGLYFTSPGSGTFNVVNTLLAEDKGGLETTDMLQLHSGQYWISTWGYGVKTLSGNMRTYDAGIYQNMPPMDNVKRIQYHQVWALYQHTDGKVWMGCQAGNYMLYDTLSRQTKFLTDTVFGGSTIKYITGDKKGNLWFSTFRGLLAKYDGKKLTAVRKMGSIISKILIDPEGLLWVAVENNGLFCLSADGTKIIKHYTSGGPEGEKLFLNSGKDIELLNDSMIVFGAGAMNFINKKTGKVHWLTYNDGLPGNSILRMRTDRNGYVWMITLDGLCRYNPDTKRVTSYGRKDGITLAHLTTEADLFSRDGYVMFTGSNALIYFKPSVFQNSMPRDVVITDFKLLNNFMPVDSLLTLSRIQLSNSQNSFSIYFASLSYLQREKLTYYYKMTGIDDDWVKDDRQNFINYSLLPPGNYTFNVYCEDIDGNRSPNITQVHIYIKPPFWRTYWFISALFFIIALCIYFVHRLRVNKLLAVEKLRNRVARDLHDDMGSTLSTINILSSMAKSRINVDPVKTTEYLGKISDNSQRMMDAMDDIVWSIKPSNDNMQKISARMREFATNVLEAKEIELDFRVDETVFDVKLDMEARRDFFLAFKEAVNNAAKYSKASMVTIQLGLHSKRLILVVEDDGVGFDPSLADNGNGLGNMQKRADAMHGRLQILSKPSGGARVTINIPVQ